MPAEIVDGFATVVQKHMVDAAKCASERSGQPSLTTRPCDWVRAVVAGTGFEFRTGRSGKTVAAMPLGLVELLMVFTLPDTPLRVVFGMEGVWHLPMTHMRSGKVQSAVERVTSVLIGALHRMDTSGIFSAGWGAVTGYQIGSKPSEVQEAAFEDLLHATRGALFDLRSKDGAVFEFLRVLGCVFYARG